MKSSMAVFRPRRHSNMSEEQLIKLQKQVGFWLKVSAPVIILVLLVIFAGRALIGVVTPFVAAFILAYILDPPVTFLEKRLKVSRVLAVTLLYLVIFVVLGTVFSFIGAQIVNETGTFIDQFQKVYGPRIGEWFVSNFQIILAKVPEETKQNLQETATFIWSQILSFIDAENLKQTWDQIRQWMQDEEIRRNAGTVAKGIGATFSAVGLFVITAVGAIVRFFTTALGLFSILTLTVIITFYILISFSALKARIKELFPQVYKDDCVRIAHKIDIQLSSYLRGQLTIAIVIGAFSSIALTIIGVPYAVIIGLFAGVANLIPYLGPVVGATPAVIVTILEHYPDWQGEILFGVLKIIAAFVIIQTVDGFFISPKIMGKALNLNPMVILFALLLGGALLGFLGMLLAMPTLCVIRVIINEIYLRRAEHAPTSSSPG